MADKPAPDETAIPISPKSRLPVKTQDPVDEGPHPSPPAVTEHSVPSEADTPISQASQIPINVPATSSEGDAPVPQASPNLVNVPATSNEEPASSPTGAGEAPTVPLVEAEDDTYATDSAYDAQSVVSSTQSISSSIYRYRAENGRTYHAYKDGAYNFPNDETELDRLDLQHHEFSLLFNTKLFTAPLDMANVHRVLDVGCGTGIWSIDFGDENPNTQVLGVDLSPIQPTSVPPNVMFEVDDIEERWLYTYKFDFIYSRMMMLSLDSYPKFFRQSSQFLQPGGFLEMVDPAWPVLLNDGVWPEDSGLEKWSRLLGEGCLKIGRDPECARHYKAQMEAAGFINVTEKVYMVPNNTWPRDPNLKELGMWQCENIAGPTGGIEALSAAIFTRVLGWSKQELDVLLAFARNQHKDTRVHSYYEFFVVVGQKPL